MRSTHPHTHPHTPRPSSDCRCCANAVTQEIQLLLHRAGRTPFTGTLAVKRRPSPLHRGQLWSDELATSQQRGAWLLDCGSVVLAMAPWQTVHHWCLCASVSVAQRRKVAPEVKRTWQQAHFSQLILRLCTGSYTYKHLI